MNSQPGATADRALAQPRVILFEIFREGKGWRVRIDGESCGHYSEEKAALTAAQIAAHAIVEKGGVAELTYGRVDGSKS